MEQTLEINSTPTVEEAAATVSEIPLRKKIATLAVLSLALVIIIVDTTILNVSLATIIRDFKTDLQSIQWVITAYSLTLAALTITGGRLGDLFGRKKMFVFGAAIFAIGSSITALSQNVPQMIAGEAIIEGIGAAMMLPATASLLVANFRGRERALAFGVWGGIAAASAAIGPIIGGYLTTNFSWRWGFGINVIVVLFLLAGSILIPESQDREEKPQLDFVGIFLSVIGLLGIVFGVIEASRYGWFHAKEIFSVGSLTFDLGNYSIVPFAIGIGLLFIIFFLLWEFYVDRKGDTPLVSLSLFKNRQFTSGVLVTAILSLGQTGLIFSIPVFLQSVRNLSAFQTGLALLPMSLTLLVAAPLSAFFGNRIRPKYLILTGLLINALGYFVLRQSISIDATSLSLAPGFIIFGAGMGLVFAQVSNMTLSAVSVEEAGEASGVNNTFRQIGSTLGSAIIGSILLTAIATNLTSGITNSNKIPENLKAPISQAVSKQTSSIEFGSGAKIDASLPKSLGTEIVAIGHQATVTANKEVLLFGVGFALLGFIAALFLPNVKNVERNQSLAHKKD